MSFVEVFKQYLEHLFKGRRARARELIFSAVDRGVCVSKLLQNIIWPTMEQIEQLYRQHKISRITEHMAIRINRTIADQLQAHLPRKPKNGKRMIVTCSHGETEELGAQMTADLFEAQGWSVWFLGSGVPDDEILQLVGQLSPEILCIYGEKPAGVPNTRKLIETIRGVGVCENMQILVSGGVFNRAEGLAEEIKADLFASNVTEAIQIVDDNPVRIPKPDVPEPGRRRKRKKRQAPTATAKTMKQTEAAVKA